MLNTAQNVHDVVVAENMKARDDALVLIGRHLERFRHEVDRMERVLARCLDDKTLTMYEYRQERMAYTVRFIDETHQVIWEETVREEN